MSPFQLEIANRNNVKLDDVFFTAWEKNVRALYDEYGSSITLNCDGTLRHVQDPCDSKYLE